MGRGAPSSAAGESRVINGGGQIAREGLLRMGDEGVVRVARTGMGLCDGLHSGWCGWVGREDVDWYGGRGGEGGECGRRKRDEDEEEGEEDGGDGEHEGDAYSSDFTGAGLGGDSSFARVGGGKERDNSARSSRGTVTAAVSARTGTGTCAY